MLRILPLVIFAQGLLAAQAFAQSDSVSARRAQVLATVPIGAQVRVFTNNTTVSGTLQRLANDTLYLDGQRFNVSALNEIEVRMRATRTGRKVGSIVGAAGGAGFGVFVGVLINVFCETECSENNDVLPIVGGLVGGLAGFVAGSVTGGVIGAAIPKWYDITDKNARPSHAPRGNIGSFSLTPTYAAPARGESGGVGLRAALMFQTQHLSIGPELGAHGLGTNMRPTYTQCDNFISCLDTVPVKERVVHGGFISRVGTGIEKRFEPYGTLGLGVYTWDRGRGLGSLTLVGYSLGAGATLRNTNGKRAAFAEARWQSNLSRGGFIDNGLGFYTIGIGGTLAW
jgi:hypothetical protein